MKPYGFFEKMRLSFSSGESYREVALRDKGTQLGYFSLLVVLCTLVNTAGFSVMTYLFTHKQLDAFVTQVPDITIENGVAKVKGEQPAFIRDPSSDQIIAIVDTTGEYEGPNDFVEGMLLTKTTFVTKNPGQTNTISLTDLHQLFGDPIRINPTNIEGQILFWTNVVCIGYFPFVTFFTFGYRLIEALILTLLGLIIASGKQPTLSFGTIFRISILALTPVMVFNTVVSMFLPGGVLVILWWFACLAIPLYYLYFGIRAATKYAPDPTESDFYPESDSSSWVDDPYRNNRDRGSTDYPRDSNQGSTDYR